MSPPQRPQQQQRDPLAPRSTWSPTQCLAWSALCLATGASDPTVRTTTARGILATVVVYLRAVVGLAVLGPFVHASDTGGFQTAAGTCLDVAQDVVTTDMDDRRVPAFWAFVVLTFGCDVDAVAAVLCRADRAGAARGALSMARRLDRKLRARLPTAEGISARDALDVARAARERGETLTPTALHHAIGPATVRVLVQDIARATVELNLAVDDPTTTYTVEDRDAVLRCLRQQPATCSHARHTVASQPTAVSP